jgi:hypothetical protein
MVYELEKMQNNGRLLFEKISGYFLMGFKKTEKENSGRITYVPTGRGTGLLPNASTGCHHFTNPFGCQQRI